MYPTYEHYLFYQRCKYGGSLHGPTGWAAYRYGIYSRYLAARMHKEA